MTKHQMQAMEALFAFSAAMDEGGLSIADLEEVVRMAVAAGHELMLINLAMAKLALERAKR